MEPARIVAQVDLDVIAEEATIHCNGRRTGIPINQFGHVVGDDTVSLAEAHELAYRWQRVITLPLDNPIIIQGQAPTARAQEAARLEQLAASARGDREAAKDERHRAG